MTAQKHIINRQVLEIHLPATADAFTVQQELSALCRQQLTAVMDRVFGSHTNSLGNQPIQIDSLTLDLGELTLDNFAIVFEGKLQEELITYQPSESVGTQNEVRKTKEKTPFRVITHYLKNGILPWWSQEASKTFVQQQMEQLLQKPPRNFIQLLQQLRWNPKQQLRFVHSTTEKQKVAALQLIAGITLEKLLPSVNKFQQRIQKKYPFSNQKIQTVFWEAAFQYIHKAATYASFEQECIQHTELALGIQSKERNFGKSVYAIYAMRTILGKLKTKYPTNTQWKDFFMLVSQVMAHPFFDQLSERVLKEWMQLLEDIGTTAKSSKEQKDPVAILRPLAGYIQGVQKELQQFSKKSGLTETQQLSSPFEDTDFIPIENAGLVLFWPFLVRFFENLELIQEKAFTDETARHTAICALQYLCEGEDQELFEGALPLNKLLCGVAIEEVISPITLSEEKKVIAEGLLTAVIGQGPHWKNLSIDGFRTSYLCRPGSLRTRDGHWLLQVQRETHDITLEKLPWGFHTVKLPWMQEVIVVEWL